MEVLQLETNNVKDVYNKIANNFDITRTYYWKFVRFYLKNIENSKDTKIMDLGCGNGRYIPLMNNFDVYAVDNSEELLKIVHNKYPRIKIFCLDVTSLIFNENFFDNIISVAVIHHLSTENRRISMINEICRVLKKGGTALITAWSTDLLKKKMYKKLDGKNNFMIPWNNKYERFYHLFEINEFEELINKSSYRDLIYIQEKVFECDNLCIVIVKK